MKKIGIIMGSDSDFPVVEKAVKTLEEFKVPYEVHIFSAHRTPEHAKDFSNPLSAKNCPLHLSFFFLPSVLFEVLYYDVLRESDCHNAA